MNKPYYDRQPPVQSNCTRFQNNCDYCSTKYWESNSKYARAKNHFCSAKCHHNFSRKKPSKAIVSLKVDDLPNEVWEESEVYKGYFGSNLGRVKSYRQLNPKILSQRLSSAGYPVINISQSKRKVVSTHRFLAEIFIPNPDKKPQINHKNGVKTDNRIKNLEWVTAKENSLHSIANNFRNTARGCRSHCSKLQDSDVLAIRALREVNPTLTYARLGRMFNLGGVSIRHIITRKTWTHI